MLLNSVVVTAYLIPWRFILLEKIILIIILAVYNRVAIVILVQTAILIILRWHVFQFSYLFEITFPIIESLPILLEIVNSCIQIIGTFFQHTESLVAASLVVKYNDYHIPIDFFSVIRVIFQDAFSFLQLFKGLLCVLSFQWGYAGIIYSIQHILKFIKTIFTYPLSLIFLIFINIFQIIFFHLITFLVFQVNAFGEAALFRFTAFLVAVVILFFIILKAFFDYFLDVCVPAVRKILFLQFESIFFLTVVLQFFNQVFRQIFDLILK